MKTETWEEKIKRERKEQRAAALKLFKGILDALNVIQPGGNWRLELPKDSEGDLWHSVITDKDGIGVFMRLETYGKNRKIEFSADLPNRGDYYRSDLFYKIASSIETNPSFIAKRLMKEWPTFTAKIKLAEERIAKTDQARSSREALNKQLAAALGVGMYRSKHTSNEEFQIDRWAFPSEKVNIHKFESDYNGKNATIEISCPGKTAYKIAKLLKECKDDA